MEDEYEYECYFCKGNKSFKIVMYDAQKNNILGDKDYNIKCPMCKGIGKVDWIKNIMKRDIKDNMIFESVDSNEFYKSTDNIKLEVIIK